MKGELIFKGAVYAKSDGSKVTVRDIPSVSKTFENCMIEEANGQSECLILQPTMK